MLKEIIKQNKNNMNNKTKSTFYWECLDQNYPFNPHKKYLIYFKGCYCPPTRGHFDTVKRFTDMGSNIHVMIHQMGSQRRHGIPYHLNKEIWETYIEELLPQNQVYLIRYESSEEILELPNIDYFDTVIYIRGNEHYNIKKTQRSNLNRFRSIIRRLNRRNIRMDFYYLKRPDTKKLSATKFTKMLIRTKKRCRRDNCNCKYKKLKFFIPTDLSEDSAMRIINDIQEHYLIV